MFRLFFFHFVYFSPPFVHCSIFVNFSPPFVKRVYSLEGMQILGGPPRLVFVYFRPFAPFATSSSTFVHVYASRRPQDSPKTPLGLIFVHFSCYDASRSPQDSPKTRQRLAKDVPKTPNTPPRWLHEGQKGQNGPKWTPNGPRITKKSRLQNVYIR